MLPPVEPVGGLLQPTVDLGECLPLRTSGVPDGVEGNLAREDIRPAGIRAEADDGPDGVYLNRTTQSCMLEGSDPPAGGSAATAVAGRVGPDTLK